MVQPRVVFLANGAMGSAAAVRADRIAAQLDDLDAAVLHRGGSRVSDIARFARCAHGADLVYAVDLAVTPVLAAAARPRSAKLAIDTGDAPGTFLELVDASRAKVAAARWMEAFAYRSAVAFVVRGEYHQTFLREQGFAGDVSVVPDGVDLETFEVMDDRGLREQLGLARAFTVGIQGHFTWYPKLGGGLGWELLQAIARRPDLPLHAVLIGDGPGVVHLRRLAHDLGVPERLHVIGRVPYQSLPRYLAMCDVCLLTQTNEPSSWVRTTGKLPVYLAAGRSLLATRVGTAATLLPEEMLLDYHGSWDVTYPERLADALGRVIGDPERSAKGWALRQLAERFEYSGVAAQAARLVREIVA